jgi:hypothetical protein
MISFDHDQDVRPLARNSAVDGVGEDNKDESDEESNSHSHHSNL